MPDLLNSFFQLGGAFVVWLSVRQLLRTKNPDGVSLVHVAFFTTWGAWNLYYYPHLEQWFTFAASCMLFIGDATWCWLLWKYRRREPPPLEGIYWP